MVASEQHTAFLCHSGANKDFVRDVNIRLEKMGIQTFFDEHSIHVGDTLTDTIYKAIKDCKIAVIFCSETFFDINSTWPQAELEEFLKRLERGDDIMIIPVVIDMTHEALEKVAPRVLTKIKYVKQADTGDKFRVQKVADFIKERHDFLAEEGVSKVESDAVDALKPENPKLTTFSVVDDHPVGQPAAVISGDLEKEIITPALNLLKDHVGGCPLFCKEENDYGLFCVLRSKAPLDFTAENIHLLAHLKGETAKNCEHPLISKVETVKKKETQLLFGGTGEGKVKISISGWSYKEIPRYFFREIDECFAKLCKSPGFLGDTRGDFAKVFAVVTRAHEARLDVKTQMIKGGQEHWCTYIRRDGVIGIQVRYFMLKRDEQGHLKFNGQGHFIPADELAEFYRVPFWRRILAQRLRVLSGLLLKTHERIAFDLGSATIIIDPTKVPDDNLSQIDKASPDQKTGDGQGMTVIQVGSVLKDVGRSMLALLWACAVKLVLQQANPIVVSLLAAVCAFVTFSAVSKNFLHRVTKSRTVGLCVAMLSSVPACVGSDVDRTYDAIDRAIPLVLGVVAGSICWFLFQKIFGRKPVFLEDPSGITLVPHSPEALYNNEFDQYMRWTKLEKNNARSQVNKERALDALLRAVKDLYYRGDVDIRPLLDNGGGDGEGTKSLLDAIDDPNELKRALAQQLFSADLNDPSLRIRVGRQEDGSVKVSANIHNYEQLARLRNKCLSGEAARNVTDSLKKAGELEEEIAPNIEFDKTSVALMFEKLILRLESMTDHQQKVLADCENDTKLHIEAPAGTGKTFVAVNLVLEYMENSDGHESILYVCCNASLGFQFCKWLCHRMRKQKERINVLKRICLLTAAQPHQVNVIGYDVNEDLLIGTKCNEESFGMIVVDEAHDVFRRDSSLHTSVEEVLDKNEEAKWLFLSDRSQSESGAVELGGITSGREWKSVKLTEVVRSTVRIMLGAKCFQLSAIDVRSFAHEHDGLPLVPVFFSGDPNSLFREYVEHICGSIEKVRKTFPGLDLSDRLAVIVPDNDFLEGLRKANLEDELKRLSLCSVSAESASRNFTVGKQSRDGKSESRIVIDTVEEMNGLERLIVFGVGLDNPIGDLADRRIACSRIYRAITRAQLLFYFINEEVEGGWYEWMHDTELSDTDGRLDYERESTRVKNQEALELLSGVEDKGSPDQSVASSSAPKSIKNDGGGKTEHDILQGKSDVERRPKTPPAGLSAIKNEDKEEKRESPKVASSFLDTSNTSIRRTTKTKEPLFNPLAVYPPAWSLDGERDLLDDIRSCQTIGDFIRVYDSDPFQYSLRRIEIAQGFEDKEEWSRKWAIDLRDSDGSDEAFKLNRDRKACLELLYCLCNKWRDINGVLDNATVTEKEITDEFHGDEKVARILGLCLVMDRAQALYKMQIRDSSDYGMHWYAQQHLSSSEWAEATKEFGVRNGPTLNKRIIWLMDIDDLGLRKNRFLTEWIKPLSCHDANAPRERDLFRQREGASKATSTTSEEGLVFLSHTGQDETARNFAAFLKRALDQNKIPAFHDVENIPSAVDFAKHIENQVKQCSVFVAILSPTYFERYWCMRELYLALAHERRVLPVYYGINRDDDLPQDETAFCAYFSSDKRVTEEELHEWWIIVHEQLPKLQGLMRSAFEGSLSADVLLIDEIAGFLKELLPH